LSGISLRPCLPPDMELCSKPDISTLEKPDVSTLRLQLHLSRLRDRLNTAP
jgi:hypothetical protein